MLSLITAEQPNTSPPLIPGLEVVLSLITAELVIGIRTDESCLEVVLSLITAELDNYFTNSLIAFGSSAIFNYC